MFDIPIQLFVVYIGIQFAFVAMAFAHSPKIPVLILLAGLMMFPMISLTDNIIMGYTNERSIKTNTVFIAGDEASSITLTHYNVTSGSTEWVLSSIRPLISEKVDTSSSLIGDTIDQVCLALRKTGSPTGNAVIGIWSDSSSPTSSNFLHQFGTQDVSMLTTSLALYCYQSTDYTLSSGEVIGIYHNSGSAGNQPSIFVDNTNPFDGTNSYQRYFQNSAWNAQTGNDIRGNMTVTFDLEATDNIETNSHDTVGNTPIREPFTEWPKIMFGAYSSALMLIGALIYQKEK